MVGRFSRGQGSHVGGATEAFALGAENGGGVVGCHRGLSNI